MTIPAPEEVERRVRRASQLREIVLTLKRAGREAYARGEMPYQPLLDERADVDYWRARLAEYEARGSTPPGE